MRTKILWGIVVFLMVYWGGVQDVRASVIINEFLADPGSGLSGDANNDGERNSSEDEFIELYNPTHAWIDLSGWTIEDASGLRHVFAEDAAIRPLSAFVVFGGGSPLLPEIDWAIASEGTLSLNNGGDAIFLLNQVREVVDSVIYGEEAAVDQSLVRNPEGTNGVWIPHSLLTGSDGALFSPGYLVSVSHGDDAGTVPEPVTFVLCLLGFPAAFKLAKP